MIVCDIMSRSSRPAPLTFLALCCAAAAVLLTACASAPRGASQVEHAAERETGAAAENLSPQDALARRAALYLADRGIPRLASTMPKLYFSSADWSARALELVENAQDYILVSTFLINSHEINAPIMDALERKARAGVRVYLIFDSSSYFTYAPDKKSYFPAALARFAGTPVRVTEYNPISGAKIFALPSLFDRDHRKFWIVDGTYLAIGGMNLNYYSLVPPGGYSNIDTFVEIEGAEPVSLMVKSFCSTWNRFSPQAIDPGSFDVPSTPQADNSVWIIDQIPGEGSPVSDFFDAFFLCAEKELWLLQAYTFTTPSLVRKVADAVKRGVKVHIVFSTNSFRTVYEEAALYCAEGLLKAGAAVYLFDGPDDAFLHYKLFLADRRLTAFGSANYNFRSQHLSRENVLISADPRLAAIAAANLDTLIPYARPINIEEARRYRGFKYWISYLSMLFGG